MNRIIHRSPKAQRGVTLVEALVGFVVVSLGALSAARLQHDLRLGADITRQRGDAVRLAQQDLELLRGFTSDADLEPSRRTATAGTASYEVERGVEPDRAASFKAATVKVSWTDNTGKPQDMSLASMLSSTSPTLAAALSVRRFDTPHARVGGRAASIPVRAKDLGNGRSAWKPTASATIAYVFDNASGLIVSSCDRLAPDRSTQQLTVDDLQSCSETRASLLSGAVRTSGANAVPAFSVLLTLAPASKLTPPSCSTEAQKVVSIVWSSGALQRAVAADARPADVGVSAWTETGERFVAYHCVVMTPANGWSGRSTLVPSGWQLGARAVDRKVCRYSADQDGSGAIDSNAEHPEDYKGVTGSLMQQNFLIMAGDQACPVAAPLKLDGRGLQVYADMSTVQHQP